MISVIVYIHDDRYDAPTWRTADILAEEAASFARHLVNASEHYRRVDLVLDDMLIASAHREEPVVRDTP